MNRFIAQLKNDSCINIAADKMDLCGTGILVWRGEAIVAYLDMDAVTSAHLSERAERT